MVGTPGIPQVTPECWCVRFAPVGQRGLVHPNSTITLGEITGDWETVQQTIEQIGGTAVDLPIYNAQGFEVGDVRAVEICVPDGNKSWRGDQFLIDSPFGASAIDGTWNPSQCKEAPLFSIDCMEEQARYVGLDNTFTNFADTATYCVETDGGAGPTIEFSQLPVTGAGFPGGPWAEQFVTQLAPNLSDAATNAGVKWIIEAAFVDNSNPSNISGNTSSGASSGLPGVLTESIAQSFVDNSMSWRFLQITVCPGSPVPTRFFRKTSEIYAESTSNPAKRDLLITPVQLGPFREFRVCESCIDGEVTQEWYVRNDNPDDAQPVADDDGVLMPYSWDRITDSGKIPKCAVPCGTVAQSPSPTKPTCDVETLRGCDNGNVLAQDENGIDICQQVNRIYQYCDGSVSVSHTIDVDDGAGGFVTKEYKILGQLVDCSTKLPLEDPPTPCDDFISLGNMWHLKLNGPPSTLVEWWADPDGQMNGTAVDHDNVSNIFTNDGSTLNHVSGPADNSYIAPTFSVEGTNAGDFISGMGLAGSSDSAGTDQGKLSTHFFLKKDALLRDGGTRTGERGGIWLNECCAGDLELVSERTTDTTSADRGVFNGVVIPAGIHYGEGLISDLSAWWNFTAQASFDGGATYGDLIGYADKPEMECIPVIKCKDSGILLNAVTGDVLDPENLFCENPCAVVSDGGDTTGLCECIADLLMVDKPDVCDYSVSFKSSGITSLLTDKGQAVTSGPHDFAGALAPPESSANSATMTAAANDIQAFLDANGGGTVVLEYISTSILEIRITGTSCVIQSADDDSNPGPHSFTKAN